jgi:uncharacterized protein YjiS (DUF1127 family)
MSAITPKQIWTRFVTWQERLVSRVEINNLNERTLRDIGLRRDHERRMHSTPPLWVPGVY